MVEICCLQQPEVVMPHFSSGSWMNVNSNQLLTRLVFSWYYVQQHLLGHDHHKSFFLQFGESVLFSIACTGNIDLFDRMVEQFSLSPNAWDKVRL